MKTLVKKLSAIALILVLCISIFPVSAFAVDRDLHDGIKHDHSDCEEHYLISPDEEYEMIEQNILCTFGHNWGSWYNVGQTYYVSHPNTLNRCYEWRQDQERDCLNTNCRTYELKFVITSSRAHSWVNHTIDTSRCTFCGAIAYKTR